MAFRLGPEKHSRKFPAALHTAAFIALLIGAPSALGMMLFASRHQHSLLLLFLFAAWVLSPFLLAAFLNIVSRKWPAPSGITVNVTILALMVISLTIYADVAIWRPRAKIGSPFLMVPLASSLVMVAVALIARFLFRKPS